MSQFPLPMNKWMKDSDVSACTICQNQFIKHLFSSGKHHCRKCGKIVCKSCSTSRVQSYRVCDACFQPGAIFNFPSTPKQHESLEDEPKLLSSSYKPTPFEPDIDIKSIVVVEGGNDNELYKHRGGGGGHHHHHHHHHHHGHHHRRCGLAKQERKQSKRERKREKKE
eukprot:98636_1